MSGWEGRIVSIFVAAEKGDPMESVKSAIAHPGRGLEGDRYFGAKGSFSRWPAPHRDLTLIAEEALREMATISGVVLPAALSRRNVLVRGVPLTELLKMEFMLGEVRIRAMRRCAPCRYLARKTGIDDLVTALSGRGGIRAQIVTGGTIAVGDAIRPSPLAA